MHNVPEDESLSSLVAKFLLVDLCQDLLILEQVVFLHISQLPYLSLAKPIGYSPPLLA